MTLNELLKDLERLGKEDGALEEEIDLETLLDYCAIAEVEGASTAYVLGLKRAN